MSRYDNRLLRLAEILTRPAMKIQAGQELLTEWQWTLHESVRAFAAMELEHLKPSRTVATVQVFGLHEAQDWRSVLLPAYNEIDCVPKELGLHSDFACNLVNLHSLGTTYFITTLCFKAKKAACLLNFFIACATKVFWLNCMLQSKLLYWQLNARPNWRLVSRWFLARTGKEGG